MSQTNGTPRNATDQKVTSDDSSPTNAQPGGELDEAELDTVSGGLTDASKKHDQMLQSIANNLKA